MESQDLEFFKTEKKLIIKNIKDIEDELKQLDLQIIEESEKLETLKINACELELQFTKQNQTAKIIKNTKPMKSIQSAKTTETVETTQCAKTKIDKNKFEKKMP